MGDPVGKLFSDLSASLVGSSNNELLERAKTDHFWFAREVMGNVGHFPDTLDESEAGDWVKLFNFMWSFAAEGGIRNGVVNSPRNSLKTTILLGRCAYLIGMDRNIRILYVTNVHANAVNFSDLLKRHLESNEFLIKVFGEFKPVGGVDESDAWRQDYMSVSGRTLGSKEKTFTSATIGKTKVGQHYDIIICDDCCDQDNTRTSDAIRKNIDWFKLVGSLRDKRSKYGPGGCILDNGTRYAEGDLHGYLLGEIPDDDALSHSFEKLVLRAIEDPVYDPLKRRFVKPKLNFPHILTEDLLNEERLRGAFIFNSQYQNDPSNPDDAQFKREWFKVIKAYDIPKDLKYYIFTDFAFGLDDSNDRTALWVVGLDWERKAYCVDFDVGRWTLNERCRRVVMFAQKYNAGAVSIEQISSNEGVKSTLLRMRDEYRIKFRLQEIGGRSLETKMLRIVSMQPRFEQGKIFFVERDPRDMIGIKAQYLAVNKNGKAHGEIVDEFIKFPRAVHDDIPDALSDIDKIDNSTKSYFFPGSPPPLGWHPGMRNEPQIRGPRVVNGRVIYSPWEGQFNAAQAKQEGKDQNSFYARHAARIRRGDTGGPWGRR